MPAALVSVAALLLGAGILLLGNGLQSILLPVRATIEAFSTSSIGLIGAAYPAGFVVSCLTTPRIVRRVGHIRTFAVLAAIAAAIVLLLVLLVHPVSWVLLRIGSGFCFAGLFMVIESWLNEASTNSNRGQIFSTYMVVNLLTLTAGQMMLPLADPADFTLFAIAAMLITLGLVPVGLTTSAGPHRIERVRLRWGRLYRMSPVGVLGCAFVGLANSAFGTFGPVFAGEIGLSLTGIALFMSAALIGGALAQLPLGRLSDRMDRRKVVVLACVLAVGLAVVLALIGDAHEGGRLFGLDDIGLVELAPAILIGLIALFGASIYPIYSLCVAHTNDYVASEDFVEASSGLLLTWGIGAAIGPNLAAAVMEGVGLAGLFAYTASIHLLFCAFTIWRMTRRSPVPMAERESFVAGSTGPVKATPVSAALDPRAPDQPDDQPSNERAAAAA